MFEIWMNLLINLFAGILIFLLGLFWPVIPKSYRKYLVRRFWGKGDLGQDFVITYGAFLDSRLTQNNPPPFRYVKRYHDGRTIQFVGPWGNVVADAEVRSISYLINALSSYKERAVTVENDINVFENLDRTIVALGSGSSNQITDIILREPNNGFLEFRQEGNTFFIFDKKGGTKFIGFQGTVKKDYGIILKIPNLRFPDRFFFVCAGLGEWGTSGASWYLATKWRDLLSEFKEAFGIVVEVDLGSDQSARRVFP